MPSWPTLLTLSVPAEDRSKLAALSPADLAATLIVSEVDQTEGNSEIEVSRSKLEKCESCWRRADGVGSGSDKGFCSRCEQALEEIADDERQAWPRQLSCTPLRSSLQVRASADAMSRRGICGPSLASHAASRRPRLGAFRRGTIWVWQETTVRVITSALKQACSRI